MTRTASELQEELTAAEPQPKAKPFNAEEKSKQRKDEESQKINHGGTETRRKSCLIYKPLNKSLFEEGQKQKLATKETEEKQRSQRKIWRKAGHKNSSQAAKNFRNCSTAALGCAEMLYRVLKFIRS